MNGLAIRSFFSVFIVFEYISNSDIKQHCKSSLGTGRIATLRGSDQTRPLHASAHCTRVQESTRLQVRYFHTAAPHNRYTLRWSGTCPLITAPSVEGGIWIHPIDGSLHGPTQVTPPNRMSIGLVVFAHDSSSLFRCQEENSPKDFLPKKRRKKPQRTVITSRP